MKFSAVVLAAALGVSAHPSRIGHKHVHRSVVGRQEVEFVKAVQPVTTTVTVEAEEQAEPTSTSIAPPPPPPSSTTKAEPKPKPSAPTDNGGSTGGSGQGVSEYTPFCGGNSKRATIEQIHYKGNTGTGGNYGCNMMLAQSNVIDEYQYVISIENADSEEQECVCSNKIGADGGVNGFFNGNEAVKFTLAGNSKQHVVVDANTQGMCACGVGSIPLTSFGQFASTWLEFDMANESNNDWSGADASCLVSAALGLDIPGLKVCGSGTCSTINPGGTGTNAYLGGMEALDGVGLNLVPGKVLLETIVGYKG